MVQNNAPTIGNLLARNSPTEAPVLNTHAANPPEPPKVTGPSKSVGARTASGVGPADSAHPRGGRTCYSVAGRITTTDAVAGPAAARVGAIRRSQSRRGLCANALTWAGY